MKSNTGMIMGVMRSKNETSRLELYRLEIFRVSY